jgi:electron transfer flavoprotein alpha subunit
MALFLSLAVQIAGCGYTTKTVLPGDIKMIHVAPVKNGIDLSGEISDKDRFRVYRPGVEVDVTNAVMNRFIFDGNLKVANREKADAILEAKLIDYRRDPLRYSEGDDIQEYRLSVTIEASLTQVNGNKVLWHENLVGDTSFYLSGARAVSEDEAVAKAVEELARRVVNKTIESW